MTEICYLAYGSNLHPLRLKKRTPSARLIGTTVLPGYELSFSKRSNRDHSGKCTIGLNGNTQVHAAVYSIDETEVRLLDRTEGLGNGYSREEIGVRLAGEHHNCMTYVAQPSHVDPNLKPVRWYRDLVVEGAGYLGFPDAYLRTISGLEVSEDRDDQRRSANEALLSELRIYGAANPYLPVDQRPA